MKCPFSQLLQTRRQASTGFAALLLECIVARSEAQTLNPYRLDEKKRANARGRYDNPSSTSKRKDAGIDSVVSKVDSARLVETLSALTSFSTRWSLSPELVHARDWLKQRFIELGYDSRRVRLVELQLPERTVAHSVICGPDRLDQGFILVGAHYDTISENPSIAAPGADDDASGIAVVLEAARIFAQVELKRGVMFAAFAGEEQGLFGSQSIASLAAKEKWAIDVMVNLDMVGHVDPERPTNIIVEYDMGNADPRNDAAAKAFGLQMAQLAADYTSMTVEHTDIWSSDYMPFESKGFPCIGLYDGAADAAFYHTVQDRIGHVDLTRLTEVTRLVCAFVANTAELKSS